MRTEALHCLSEVFAQIPDPRARRGVRHPFAGMLALVFLGLLARIREFAQLQFWAAEHWDQLQGPLGFDRPQPPHATTISRALSRFSVGAFQDAFRRWLLTVVEPTDDLAVAAVDAKTCKQSLGDDGRPIQVLSVFAHRVKLALAQWEVHAEKTNEPHVLLNHLHELLNDYPMLRLITGDAVYAQRNLAEVMESEGCDYLLQVKDNQPGLHQALQQTFAHAETTQPDHEVREKKRARSKLVGFGAIWTTPNTSANSSISPTAASPCVWSVWSPPATGRPLVVM